MTVSFPLLEGGAHVASEIAFTTELLAAAPVWVDTSDRLRVAAIDRGKASEEDNYGTGTCKVLFDNTDRALEPLYAASPYYPNVVPNKLFRVGIRKSGTTHWRFTGVIEDIVLSYPGRRDAVAQLSCVDIFEYLSRVELSAAFAQTALDADPVAYWPLTETEGTVALDSGGSGFHGTYVGGPVFSQSDPITDGQDGAVLFDGVDDHIELPLGTYLPQGTGAFAIGFFIKTTNPTVRTVFIVKQPSGALWTELAIKVGDTGLLRADYEGDGKGAISFDSTVTVNDNAWHFCVLVRESDGLTWRWFVDGTQRATRTDGAIYNFGYPTLARWARGSAGGTNIPATLTKLFVWNRAPSAAEILALYESRTAWAGDLTGTRIGRILDRVGLPAWMRDLDPGNSTMPSADDYLGRTALDAIWEAEHAERGAVFASRDGKVTLIERHAKHQPAALTPTITLRATGADSHYDAPQPEMRLSRVKNRVTGTRKGGSPQAVEDAVSVDALKGRRTLGLGTIAVQEDELVKALLDYELQRRLVAQLQIPTVGMQLLADSVLQDAALVLDLEARIRLLHRPPDAGADQTYDLHVQGIKETISPKIWSINPDLRPADSYTYWIVGVPGFSEVGQTTRVGV